MYLFHMNSHFCKQPSFGKKLWSLREKLFSPNLNIFYSINEKILRDFPHFYGFCTHSHLPILHSFWEKLMTVFREMKSFATSITKRNILIQFEASTNSSCGKCILYLIIILFYVKTTNVRKITTIICKWKMLRGNSWNINELSIIYIISWNINTLFSFTYLRKSIYITHE